MDAPKGESALELDLNMNKQALPEAYKPISKASKDAQSDLSSISHVQNSTASEIVYDQYVVVSNPYTSEDGKKDTSSMPS